MAALLALALEGLELVDFFFVSTTGAIGDNSCCLKAGELVLTNSLGWYSVSSMIFPDLMQLIIQSGVTIIVLGMARADKYFLPLALVHNK